MIEIRINDVLVEVQHGTCVWTVVTERVGRVEGVAVACNDAIVPRSEWADTVVCDGDRIEILVAAQGG